jgi:hypothetical protein
MNLRLHNILAICLALLVMVGRAPMAHVGHGPAAYSQQHQCERRDREAPAPIDRDCADICALCTTSLEDIGFPPPLAPRVIPVSNNETSLRYWIATFVFAPQTAPGWHYARAPPFLLG